MNRRSLIRRTLAATAALALYRSAGASHTPVTSPVSRSIKDQPVDTRSRNLVDRLLNLSPLAVLGALEIAQISHPSLINAAGDISPIPRPWNDPLDTDLEHGLGGVLIVTNDEPVNSPNLQTLGSYVVYESAEIAYDQLMRQMDELEQSMTSTSVAGTKAWIVDDSETHFAVMRLAYVVVMADISDMQKNTAEGIVLHLDAVTQAMIYSGLHVA